MRAVCVLVALVFLVLVLVFAEDWLLMLQRRRRVNESDVCLCRSCVRCGQGTNGDLPNNCCTTMHNPGKAQEKLIASAENKE